MPICSYCGTEYHLKPSKIKQNRRGVFFCTILHKKLFYTIKRSLHDKPETSRKRSKRYLNSIKQDKGKYEQRLMNRRKQDLKRKYGEYWETKLLTLETEKTLRRI